MWLPADLLFCQVPHHLLLCLLGIYYAACTVQPSWGPYGAVEGSEGSDGVGAFPSLELSDNSWEAFDGDEEGGFPSWEGAC